MGNNWGASTSVNIKRVNSRHPLACLGACRLAKALGVILYRTRQNTTANTEMNHAQALSLGPTPQLRQRSASLVS
eukprot:scaffold57810_cov66-Phaeocystis_antarctica.AAC.3